MGYKKFLLRVNQEGRILNVVYNPVRKQIEYTYMDIYTNDFIINGIDINKELPKRKGRKRPKLIGFKHKEV